MHWNLPSNPQDLEQREGRINRYKCLAIRRNLAKLYPDIYNWDELFKVANADVRNEFGNRYPGDGAQLVSACRMDKRQQR